MKEDGIWHWFTRWFRSDHFAAGRQERSHWWQLIKDDQEVRTGDKILTIEIEDIRQFPKDNDIKNIDNEAVIERKYKTSVIAGKRFIADYIDDLRSANYSLNETAEDVEIEFCGNINTKSTEVPHIDNFLSKVMDIHNNKECGSYIVSLDILAGKIDSGQIIEGAITKEVRKEEKYLTCNVIKNVDGISLSLALKDYDIKRALSLYELFNSCNSSDKDKIYKLLFTAIDSQYTFPSYLSGIKNKYESYLSQLMGRCVKKVSVPRERLAKLLASYESISNSLYNVANLENDFKAKKNITRRLWLFFIGLFLLSVLDLGLNYFIFDAVLQEKYETLLWVTTIGYGVILVAAAEAYVFLCADYKDALSLRSLIILLPLTVLFLSSGYIRYLFEVIKGASDIGGQTLESLNASESGQDTLKPLVISVFFTFFSLLIFICAVLLGYWQKYGNLRTFLNSYSLTKLDEKIRRCGKKINNILAAYYNENLNHLIQSAHREYDEYINGFEHPSEGEKMTDIDKKRFTGLLFWLKENNKRMLKVEPGSQINKDEFNNIKYGVEDKMLHYLKIKNKAIAFKMGFDDAVNNVENKPERVLSNPFFHKEDTSICANLTDENIRQCFETYNYGYLHGEKAVQNTGI